MTIPEAEKEIIDAGGDLSVFWDWMQGQTMSLYSNGDTDVYEEDVERFIRYRCNPKNEPMAEFD